MKSTEPFLLKIRCHNFTIHFRQCNFSGSIYLSTHLSASSFLLDDSCLPIQNHAAQKIQYRLIPAAVILTGLEMNNVNVIRLVQMSICNEYKFEHVCGERKLQLPTLIFSSLLSEWHPPSLAASISTLTCSAHTVCKVNITRDIIKKRQTT